MLQSEIYAKDAVQLSDIAHQSRPRQNDSVVPSHVGLRRCPALTVVRSKKCRRGAILCYSGGRLIRETSTLGKR